MADNLQSAKFKEGKNGQKHTAVNAILAVFMEKSGASPILPDDFSERRIARWLAQL
jgi:hypothetical protein